MSDVTRFLGEPVEFWVELRKKADTLDVTYLIQENASMRAKVSYFDEMLRRTNAFAKEV